MRKSSRSSQLQTIKDTPGLCECQDGNTAQNGARPRVDCQTETESVPPVQLTGRLGTQCSLLLLFPVFSPPSARGKVFDSRAGGQLTVSRSPLFYFTLAASSTSSPHG